ncbi:MAG TPA: GNAT family N-acetyltransferase [Caulobacteraceae bacterium]|nr:GNAT family N-acetyltransferase [Caulobacteraceae bacterium]
MEAWRDHPIRLPPTLSDGVVRLDAPRLEDAKAHWAGEDLEMIRRFDPPLHRKGTLEQVRGLMAQWAQARADCGPMFVYAIRAPDGSMEGGVELRRITPERANVSYWVYAGFRGRGYASRALRLIGEAAGGVEGLAQLEAHIDADNLASQRVARAAGFAAAGEIDDEDVEGRPIKRLLFRKLL